MSDGHAIFEVSLSFEVEMTQRDEFGWADGHGPGEAAWKPLSMIFRAVCSRPSQARELAAARVAGAGIRNVTVLGVARVKLDALVFELPT